MSVSWIDPTQMFKALADPVRWEMVQQIASGPRLAWEALEAALPLSKPTISHHAKVLVNAGLIVASKEGRHTYYSLGQQALGGLLQQIGAAATDPTASCSSQPSSPPCEALERRTGSCPTRLLTW